MTAAARLAEAMRASARIRDRADLVALARIVGIEPRIAGRAFKGITVAAEHHLNLAAAVAFDPVTGRRCRRIHEPHTLLWGMVRGAVFLRMRFPVALSQREAAKVIGLSPATLCRLEAGEAISAESYIALCHWLGWPGCAPLVPAAAYGAKCFSVSAGVPRETAEAA